MRINMNVQCISVDTRKIPSWLMEVQKRKVRERSDSRACAVTVAIMKLANGLSTMSR